MIECANQSEPTDDGIHLEISVHSMAGTPFGPVSLGEKAIGCRFYTQEMVPDASMATMDKVVAALLHDIANGLNPMDERLPK